MRGVAAMTKDTGQRGDPWLQGEGGCHQPTTLDDLIAMRPYTKAEDEKGHDVLLSARVPKRIARLMGELAFARSTPYRTLSDSVRDALYLGWQVQRLRYHDSLSEAADAEAKALQLAVEIGEDTAISETVRAVADDLSQLEAGGELDRAVERLTEYVRLVGAFADQWRRRRFLYYLRGRGVVRSLAAHAKDDDVRTLLIGEEAPL